MVFRVARVWPTLLFILFAYQALLYWVGDGSTWTEMENLVSQCDDYWWTPLLFVNDFVPFF